MGEPDELVIDAATAASRYAEAKRLAEEATSEMNRMKEVLERLLGSVTEVIDTGEWTVQYVPGAVRRKPNAADLLADGYRPEEFGTFSPSITKLRALAKERGWDTGVLEGYLLDGEAGSPKITVKRNRIDEDAEYEEIA